MKNALKKLETDICLSLERENGRYMFETQHGADGDFSKTYDVVSFLEELEKVQCSLSNLKNMLEGR